MSKSRGVDHLVEFIQADLTKAVYQDATVVTLYLPTRANKFIRPLLEKQLRNGTRVICHDYPIPGWEDKLTSQILVPDKQGHQHRIFAYKR